MKHFILIILAVLTTSCVAASLNACTQEQDDLQQPTSEPALEDIEQECERLDPRCLKQLTDDPAQDGFPSWSPDGEQIVFSRYGGDNAPEITGLWLISPDEGEPRRLTTVIGEHPDWSPDGRYIAFDGDYGDSIQMVAASGGPPVRIVPDSIRVSSGGQPKWSPDSSRIAFKEGSNLWALEVSSGLLEKVFSEQSKRLLPICWSQDGKEIYVNLSDAENENASIWAVSMSGESKRKVTPEEKSVYRYADLSPDGSLLVMVWCEEGACNLWVMLSAGGNRLQITSNSKYDDGPSWSPDGKRIAFVSTRSGNFEIWTVEVDMEGLRRELVTLGE